MDVEDYAKRLIHHKAVKLIGWYGFTRSDQEDIEQDLTLDLLQRLPHYDPRRAQRTTFLVRVVEHKVASTIEGRQAAKRHWRHCRTSLNVPLGGGEGGEGELADTVPADPDGREPELQDLACDLAKVIDGLPPKLRDLCGQLQKGTVTEVAGELGISRMTVYRYRQDIRARFEDAGLDAYL